ncbi:MAG: hypothetical protein ACRYG2_07420 [Janthinobacterium lividum]
MHAVRGLHAVTLSERLLDPSAGMLTDLLGMNVTEEAPTAPASGRPTVGPVRSCSGLPTWRP